MTRTASTNHLDKVSFKKTTMHCAMFNKLKFANEYSVIKKYGDNGLNI